MKKILNNLASLLILPFLIYVERNDSVKKFINLLMKILVERGIFITFHIRPRLSNYVFTKSDNVENLVNLAVIIQGQIIHKNNFTLESAKVYLKHFIGATIILSTWDDEPKNSIEEFENLGVKVVLNKKPDFSGQSSINLQIVTTRNGINYAKHSGCEYVIKSRTDQRIYAVNIAFFLQNLIKIFPVSGSWPKQKYRIVGCSLNTFKYRMYGLSDMFLYGHIEDMELYWNIKLDDRRFDDEQRRYAISSLRNFAHWQVCEVYLVVNFLKRIDRNLKWTLSDSWSAFADHFCIVDASELDLYWPKYSNLEFRRVNYGKNYAYQELYFRDWLNYNMGLGSIDVPEYYLDKKFLD